MSILGKKERKMETLMNEITDEKTDGEIKS
jgi:hypothetical protein